MPPEGPSADSITVGSSAVGAVTLSDLPSRLHSMALLCHITSHYVQVIQSALWQMQALERLAGLLESEGGSVTLTEQGSTEAVPRHSNFRIFAAMNPATDAG